MNTSTKEYYSDCHHHHHHPTFFLFIILFLLLFFFYDKGYHFFWPLIPIIFLFIILNGIIFRRKHYRSQNFRNKGIFHEDRIPSSKRRIYPTLNTQYCKNCGTLLEQDSIYCAKCGTKIVK